MGGGRAGQSEAPSSPGAERRRRAWTLQPLAPSTHRRRLGIVSGSRATWRALTQQAPLTDSGQQVREWLSVRPASRKVHLQRLTWSCLLCALRAALAPFSPPATIGCHRLTLALRVENNYHLLLRSLKETFRKLEYQTWEQFLHGFLIVVLSKSVYFCFVSSSWLRSCCWSVAPSVQEGTLVAWSHCKQDLAEAHERIETLQAHLAAHKYSIGGKAGQDVK